jgi:hypothetical protein
LGSSDRTDTRRDEMRKVIVAIAFGAAVLLSAQAALAVGGSVTARFNHDTENFHGKVRSSEAECVANRAVKVFLITDQGRELQGRTRAGDDGTWSLHLMEAHGTYVAIAPTYEAMHATCDRLASGRVDVM